MPIPAAIAAAAITGGAGILSNLIGSKNQSSANKTNLQIARENNAFNAAQAQINREWQEKMWNQANEWNSPVNQAKLAAAAGLNPLAYVEGGDFQPASTSLGGSQATSAGLPSVQPFRPDLTSIGSAAQQYFANRSEEARADILRTQADFQLIHEQNKVYDEIQSIEQKRVLTDTDRERLKMLKTQAYILSKTQESQISQIRSDADKSSAMADIAEREYFEKVITTPVRLAIQESQMRLNWKQEQELVSRMALLAQQIETEKMNQKEIEWKVNNLVSDFLKSYPDVLRENTESKYLSTPAGSKIEFGTRQFKKFVNAITPTFIKLGN